MAYCVNTISSITEQFSALISHYWGREAVKYGMVDLLWYIATGMVLANMLVCIPSKCIILVDKVDV